MTVKEMMLKLLAEDDCPDIDFCDDYDERAYVAYCGNHWTPEAEDKYVRAFNLPIDEKSSRFGSNYDIVIVHCENASDAQALADLLYAMAGYIDEQEYDRLFPEPEEDKPEPVRNPVEVVTITGAVIKAKMVEIVNHALTGLRIIDMDDNEEVVPFDQIVRIIGME